MNILLHDSPLALQGQHLLLGDEVSNVSRVQAWETEGMEMVDWSEGQH